MAEGEQIPELKFKVQNSNRISFLTAKLLGF